MIPSEDSRDDDLLLQAIALVKNRQRPPDRDDLVTEVALTFERLKSARENRSITRQPRRNALTLR